ncbi:hypothetical protein VYU27_000269 [Nannochloropsis oceanica]
MSSSSSSSNVHDGSGGSSNTGRQGSNSRGGSAGERSGAFLPSSSGTWGGSSTLSLSGTGQLGSSICAPSPLTYNSPTKRFGYTRWPPLLSPISQEAESGGGGGGSGGGGGGISSSGNLHHHCSSSFDEDAYADVRREMAQSGHNLTSVMMDPRATGGVSDQLMSALLDQGHGVTPGPGAPGGPVPASVLAPVETSDLLSFARTTGPAMERYRQNHHAGPGQVRLYRPELLSSSQKAVDGAADLAECFREVPGIFFHRDFQLSEPALFERVVVKATLDTQERLSQYLDVVETCLLKQISSRSQHFFEALTTLQDVRDRLAQACRQVLNLRAGLHDIDRKTVMGMIRIPRLAQRKVNLAVLLEKLRLIQDVQRSKGLVQSLLRAGDYMGALDVLEDGRALIREGGLAAVHCMGKLDRQLGEYLELVSDLMGSSFINLAMQFKDDAESCPFTPEDRIPPSPLSLPPQKHGPHPPADQHFSSSPYQLNEALAAQLQPRVRGLVRLCRLSKVLQRYRGRLKDTLKGVVKTVLLEYLDIADYQYEEGKGEGGKESGRAMADRPRVVSNNGNGGGRGAVGEDDVGLLSGKVKAMEPGIFLDCLKLCFEQILLPMERVGMVHAFMEEQISVELSRLLDRRSSWSYSSTLELQQHRKSEAALSTSISPSRGGKAGRGGEVSETKGGNGDSSAAAAPPPPPSRTGLVPKPPSSPGPSPSTKFKAFLDKRRMEAGGGGSGTSNNNNKKSSSSRSSSGAGANDGLGSGEGSRMQQKQAPFKDEDQIKVLELQACKRLNDEVLRTLCDLCQRHIASLLNARKDAHVRMELGQMKVLWDSTAHFVSAMERISGTAGFGLKSTLLTQAKLFVEHLHEDASAQLLVALDAERWVQADVGTERQAEIDRLIAGKAVLASYPSSPIVFAPESNERFSSSLQQQQQQQQEEGDDDGDLSRSNDAGDTAAAAAAAATGVTAAISNSGISRKKEKATEAIVGEGHYKVVWSALLLVTLLSNYLNVAANFPTLAMDVMQRVVDLLRLFNARTAQLVLGAGAIQATARLRSITAKHLALAAQCLGLVIVLIPHVRAALGAHLQAKQRAFLLELDRLRQEYAEHQGRILGKFVGIIGELVAQSAANTGLRETDWDAMGSAACRFVEEVIKGVSTMHKVLVGFLPAGHVQDVFGRVFDLLGLRLKDYLEEARPMTNAGRQRLVDEVSHLVTSLSMLRGVNAEVLTQLEMTIKEKYSSTSSSYFPPSSNSSSTPSTKAFPSESPTVVVSPSPVVLTTSPPSSPSTPPS